MPGRLGLLWHPPYQCVGDILQGRRARKPCLCMALVAQRYQQVSVGWHQAGRWHQAAMPKDSTLAMFPCVPLAKLVKSQPGHWVRVTRLLLELPVP